MGVKLEGETESGRKSRVEDNGGPKQYFEADRIRIN